MADERPTGSTERIAEADAIFVLNQFSGIYQGAHVSVVVRSVKNKALFSHHLPVDDMMREWNDWVLAAISSYNMRGSHVVYGINPIMNPRRGAACCLSTLVAYFSLKNVTLGERLKQMAVLHKAKFEPSYVIQWEDGLAGVYVLDQPLKPEQHKKLSRHIAHLIDSQSFKGSGNPWLTLPLPGFFYKGRIARLLHPIKPVAVSVRLYSAAEFDAFPEVTVENTNRFYREAKDLGDERAMEFVANLLREAKEKGDQRAVLLGLTAKKRMTDVQRFKSLSLGFAEPTKNIVPDFRAIPLKYWTDFALYVRFGSGANGDVLARLVRRILNASIDVTLSPAYAFQGLDRYLLREMIYAGYTQTAAIDFFHRPGHNIGVGKDATYISQLYQLEINALRTMAMEAQQEQTRQASELNHQSLEFVTMICNAIDRIGEVKKIPRGTVSFNGDVMGLNPKRAVDKLYLPEMVRAGKTPLSIRQLKFIFSNCKDHYWLGRFNYEERYQWRFSIQRLRLHGLLKIFTPLTKSDSELQAASSKEVANLETTLKETASTGSAKTSAECDRGNAPNSGV